jgi:hypothetical protein
MELFADLPLYSGCFPLNRVTALTLREVGIFLDESGGFSAWLGMCKLCAIFSAASIPEHADIGFSRAPFPVQYLPSPEFVPIHAAILAKRPRKCRLLKDQATID